MSVLGCLLPVNLNPRGFHGLNTGTPFLAEMWSFVFFRPAKGGAKKPTVMEVWQGMCSRYFAHSVEIRNRADFWRL
jgi:hypothetical protein